MLAENGSSKKKKKNTCVLHSHSQKKKAKNTGAKMPQKKHKNAEKSQSTQIVFLIADKIVWQLKRYSHLIKV